jgi:hypothetical protein
MMTCLQTHFQEHTVLVVIVALSGGLSRRHKAILNDVEEKKSEHSYMILTAKKKFMPLPENRHPLRREPRPADSNVIPAQF